MTERYWIADPLGNLLCEDERRWLMPPVDGRGPFLLTFRTEAEALGYIEENGWRSSDTPSALRPVAAEGVGAQ